MDYRTIKVTSTPISAELGWLRDNETIPNIKIPKLPNFPLDQRKSKHSLSFVTS